MEKKLISVIMPVYKTEEILLRKAIESIINQNYQKLQIILVEDGSPDYCGTICDSYAILDNRIQVIHKNNRGVSSARNCGLEVVKGEYIFFVDSDDTLKSNTIEKIFYIAEDSKSDITICSCNHKKKKNTSHINCDENKGCLYTVEQSEAIKILSYNMHVFDELEPTAVWGKLYKKEIIQSLKFNEKMNIGEDFVFNYYAICNSNKITYCNEKLYNYSFVETSLMNNGLYSPKLMQSFEELKQFAKSQCDTEYSNDIIARCVNIAFTIYLKVPESNKKECKLIENFICKNRKNVISNRFVNKKNKGALLTSYIGFNFVRKLFVLLT